MTVETLIVGSGVAATAIAKTLLEANPKATITILEAGTRVATKDYGIWLKYLMSGHLPYEDRWDLPYPKRDTPGENAIEGYNDFSLAGSRVFAYGGSTLHWGGWTLRLKPEDFHLFDNTGLGVNWPFGYDELEPYYCAAEDYLAVSGPSNDTTVRRSKDYPFPAFPLTLQDAPLVDAFRALGMSYGQMPIARRGVSDVPSRHAPCQTTGTCKYCPFGARYVAGNYMDDMRSWNEYQGLKIVLGAATETINLSSKSRVSGVTYLDSASNTFKTIDAECVIVAAGTVESAKLLLRSRSREWPCGVGNGSDQVGRYIVSHPYFILTGSLPENPNLLQPEMNFPTLLSRHFDSPAEQKNGGKFIFVNPPDTVPINVAGLMQAGYRRDEIDRYMRGNTPISVHGMIEIVGDSANRVTSLESRNRVGLHQTKVEFKQPANFQGRSDYVKSVAENIFKQLGASFGGFQTISWRMDHAASTCRMSSDPSTGVVNSDLRVHDIENLYVCSNAVFPNIGAINPTLTLTALALRLGKQLAALGHSGA